MISLVTFSSLLLACQSLPVKVSDIDENGNNGLATETMTMAISEKTSEMVATYREFYSTYSTSTTSFYDKTSNKKIPARKRTSRRGNGRDKDNYSGQDKNSTDDDILKMQMPIFVHLSEDEINEKQEKRNSKLQFSHLQQSVYVNLNGVCNLQSLQKLIVFLIFTLL